MVHVRRESIMSNFQKMQWVLVSVILLGGQAASADWYDDLIAAAKQHVISTEDYVFNRDVEVQLRKGQTLQLNCPANEHEIAAFLAYYYENPVLNKTEEIIRVDALFQDGSASGYGSRINGERALHQAGYTKCLVITEWRMEGDTLHMKFRASDDLKYNQDIYRQWEAQYPDAPRAYKTRDLLPVVVIPEAERLAGFARLWSEVKYNFAFFDHVPELDWDGILLAYIPKVQAAQTDVEYYRVLRECIALLKDGHTTVGGPTDQTFCEPPIRVQAVRGEAVVVQVCPARSIKNEEARKRLQAAALRRGDVVTHIDGRPVQQVLSETLYPFIFASTAQDRDAKAYEHLLRGPHGTTVVLDVVRADGSKAQVPLTRSNYRFSHPPHEFECKALEGGIIYVNLPDFASDRVVQEFDKVFEQIRPAKGLILDVRLNGGGSTRNGYAILSRLIDKSVPGSRWKSPKHIAAYKAWGREVPWEEGSHGTIEPHGAKHYAGSVVVLTGPETASAAEDFVVAFHACGRGKVIGQRTCGSTGQPLMVELPGGGGARICTKRDTYPDGREFVGIGVIPDVEVEPSRADIAAGRDPILSKALEVLSNP
jgi:carboxyl-terminal processing protease